MVEYVLLGLAAARAFIWKRRPSLGIWVLVFAACELYALTDEVHQIFVPGRAFDIPDLFLDGAGILIGLFFYWWLSRNETGSLAEPQ